MALVTRPAKIGTYTTYTEEYAAGQVKIRADEVDADIEAIIAQVNGNVDAVNLGTNAVETAKIKDANVTGPKLGTDAPIVDWKSGIASTGLGFSTVETDIVALSAAITVGTGIVTLLPNVALTAGCLAGASGNIYIRIYRDAILAGIWRVGAAAGAGGGLSCPVPNFPLVERPGVGSYIYKITGQTSSINVTLATLASDPGGLIALSWR